MAGKNDIHNDPKANTNGFDKNPQNINRKGQPISFKKIAADQLGEDGEFLISKDSFIKEKTIEGIVYSVYKIPKIQQLTFRLLTLAMSSKKDAFNALKFLIEMFDGKAKQSVDIESPKGTMSPIPNLNAEQIKKINDVLEEDY